ncbi:MAG: Ig-like domain-containing protein [Solirubrobacterales bacterium]|nr:Ig-like domain-containing protein [Solirubrobacterales bacterium]
MRETNGRQRRISTRLMAAAGALAAIFAVAVVGTTSAQAASTPGGPIATDFNYVGINVTALGNELDQLLLTPTTENPNDPPNFLPPLMMSGTYDDANGNFTLPKETGFDFPKLGIDISGAQIEAEIGLTEDAKGNYNDSTGAMTLNPKISLILGTDHLENIEGLPIQGEGPLKCQFAPLNAKLSTNPVNWPAPGAVFANTALLQDGAIAGGWDTKPKVKSLSTENAGLCTVIGNLLEPVGGLYLANITAGAPITEMPAPTAPKLEAAPCPAGTTGTPGTPPEDCKPIPPPECGEGTTGTYPDCVPIVEKTPYKVSKIKLSPSKGKLKAGKKVKLKIKVTNSGETDGSSKVTIKSSNKKVKAPKSVKINVAAGATVTKTIKLKVSKKAKGKAKITAKADGKSGKAKFKIKKAKKKK